MKKKLIFLNFSTFVISLKLHLKARNAFGRSPEPPEVSGGAPCRTDMDCIERVKMNWICLCDYCQFMVTRKYECRKGYTGTVTLQERRDFFTCWIMLSGDLENWDFNKKIYPLLGKCLLLVSSKITKKYDFETSRNFGEL